MMVLYRGMNMDLMTAYHWRRCIEMDEEYVRAHPNEHPVVQEARKQERAYLEKMLKEAEAKEKR